MIGSSAPSCATRMLSSLSLVERKMLFFGAIGGTFCAKGKFAEGFLIADPHRAKAAQREHIDNAKALNHGLSRSLS